ncbi:segregation/condensation protein A [Faecalitalea cylindroides]|uniref:segregation and condensation protein A n=1 Tax=Faecalitalea cylindroides TaxID=39483 RepID=UPI00189BDB3D|nr:segregation/condensation protein A [Faecalitalea cylindroides]MDB7946055.1 segregation/condensation protein A [Faecalitalea cylindroides]MDB7947847.1 segregation/condensation protein A [Faecalitalea cylindroides]MDB7949724.1 segregation/condensation protein A [Faecalitalea cylindroides]
MKFTVTIDQFEGPLDLMLHLIKENKLDLFDLDMNVLTTQYIEFIHQMKDFHLEIASEYLSELASLIEYKSKKLLPREEVQVEEEYEEDQRTKLVARLVEYQKYKEISEKLRIDYENRQKHFTRSVSPLVEQWSIPIESDTLENQSPYELLKAMNRVLQRMILLKPYETKVTIKELSVEERLEQIKERLKDSNDMILFETLCDDCSSLHMVIVTFLSILDLIHQKWLDFTIDSEDHIYVKRGIE